MDMPNLNDESWEDLDVVELFSGVARIGKLAWWMGFRSRCYDISYAPVKNPTKVKRGKFQRGCMDLNGAAGFVNLGLCHSRFTVLFITLLNHPKTVRVQLH